jgi:hypothetical protein
MGRRRGGGDVVAEEERRQRRQRRGADEGEKGRRNKRPWDPLLTHGAHVTSSKTTIKTSEGPKMNCIDS